MMQKDDQHEYPIFILYYYYCLISDLIDILQILIRMLAEVQTASMAKKKKVRLKCHMRTFLIPYPSERS